MACSLLRPFSGPALKPLILERLGNGGWSEQVDIFSWLAPSHECLCCWGPHCLFQLRGPARGHLRVSSPCLPLRQVCCAARKDPFTQYLRLEPCFPSTPHPSHPQSGSFTSLLASGIPGAERGERQKLRDPEPPAPRAAGRRWMCVPLSHDAYSDFISVCLQLCQDTSYSVCCIKWCLVGKQTEHH